MEQKAKAIRAATKAKEKEELNKINETLKDAAKVRAEAEKQADDYQKNAMISPDAQNKRADELLKSVKK